MIATGTIAALLQMTATLLMGVQHDVQTPVAVKAQLVLTGEHVVQIAAQAAAPVPFVVTPNDGAWPNVKDLLNAPYRNASGVWVREGQGVALDQSSVSFGDLNADGMDDAAVVVKRTGPNGTVEYALAALLNQGGIMFNIADLPLTSGTAPTVYNHRIVNGAIVLDWQKAGGARATSTYVLFGDELQAK